MTKKNKRKNNNIIKIISIKNNKSAFFKLYFQREEFCKTFDRFTCLGATCLKN